MPKENEYSEIVLSSKKLVVFHLLIIFLLVLFNLGVSFFVRFTSLYFIPNENPLGFQLGLAYSIIIILFMLWALVYFRIFIKHPIITFLIVAGGLSNFIEKWVVFNSVADYINFGFSHFNLADVEIWTGLIVLNIYVWFFDNNKSQDEK